MPSPFPGMDPYIETPELWSDFHNNLASEMQAQLNRLIQPRYFARLTPYVTYEVVEVGEVRGVRPDVGVWQLQALSGAVQAGTAIITPAPVESQVALGVMVWVVVEVAYRQVDPEAARGVRAVLVGAAALAAVAGAAEQPAAEAGPLGGSRVAEAVFSKYGHR